MAHGDAGGEVKGKLANGAGSQFSSRYLGMLLPPTRTPRLPVVEGTDAPADLNGLVRFAERRNLVSACVPSRFKRSLLPFACLRLTRTIIANYKEYSNWTPCPRKSTDLRANHTYWLHSIE